MKGIVVKKMLLQQDASNNHVTIITKTRPCILGDFFVSAVKRIFFHQNNVLAQKHILWVHVRTASASASNVYPQYMFSIKNNRNRYIPVNPSFPVQKWDMRV